MNSQEKLQKSREFFSKDIFATKVAGVVIEEVDVGYSKCSMKITPNHLNAGGNVMGGAIFTLADLAFGVACNCERPISVTLSSQIYFLGGLRGDTLFAEARVLRQGGRVGVYEIEVYDNLGTKIAYATSEGFTK